MGRLRLATWTRSAVSHSFEGRCRFGRRGSSPESSRGLSALRRHPDKLLILPGSLRSCFPVLRGSDEEQRSSMGLKRGNLRGATLVLGRLRERQSAPGPAGGLRRAPGSTLTPARLSWQPGPGAARICLRWLLLFVHSFLPQLGVCFPSCSFFSLRSFTFQLDRS